VTREHYDRLIRQLDDQVHALGELVANAIEECVDALERRDINRAKGVIDGDSQVDGQRYQIEKNAFLLLATQQPTAGDLRDITSNLIIASELERIGDYCEGIAELTLRMTAEPILGSTDDIRAMGQITRQLLLDVLQALRERDVSAAGRVWMQDDEVDELYERVYRKLLNEMIEDPTRVRRDTYLLWVAHNLERMADRVTNIAERVAFTVTGDLSMFRDELRAQTVPD
jgi:phosphate transport system protein